MSSKMDKKAIKNKINDFWEKHEIKAVLIVGFLLVSAISFEFGALQGQKWQQKPLIIEKIAENREEAIDGAQNPPKAQNMPQEGEKVQTRSNIPTQNCAFIGSKNSNKYHLPTCRWAKQIKPENIVCFASAEAATQKGYQPDKNCVK